MITTNDAETYIFFEHESLSETELQQIHQLMPVIRQKKYDSFRFDKDKKLCASAYVLLLYGLYKKTGTISTKHTFIYNDNKKPFLSDTKGIFFNISHCDISTACVINSCPVGIDIQDLVEYDANISNKILSPKEIQLTNHISNKSESFTKIWTFKESYLKCIGTGIDSTLSQIEFTSLSMDPFTKYNHFFYPYKVNNCYITICSEREINNSIYVLDISDIREFIKNIKRFQITLET